MRNQFHYSLVSGSQLHHLWLKNPKDTQSWKLFCCSLNVLWFSVLYDSSSDTGSQCLWGTLVKVWFCAVWSCSMNLFHHSTVCRGRCTENTTYSWKQPRKCCGNWNAPCLLSSHKSYLHWLFFIEVEKNGSVTLYTILILHGLMRQNRHNVEVLVSTQIILLNKM